MTRSVTGAAWIVNMFKGLHQADSGGAHVGLGQSLIVNNKFAAGANIRLWRLSAMHSECGGPGGGSGLGVDFTHVDCSAFKVSIRSRISSLAKKSGQLRMGI